MKAYIRDVEPDHLPSGDRWTIYWTFEPGRQMRSDGKCYTWDARNAKLCADARHAGVAVELGVTKTQFGDRLQAVNYCGVTV